MSNQHTWSISDAKTTEGETMIVGGAGQEFGLIAVVTDEADAKQIIADREARADAPSSKPCGSQQAVEDAIALAFNDELCRQIDAKEKTDSLSVTSKLVSLPVLQSLLSRAEPILTKEMRRLIIAARVVAFSDQGPSAIKELDEASEAFADQVAWDDQPDEPPICSAAMTVAASDWQEDPSADERWNAGLDFGQQQLCKYLGVDPDDVTWDAATEELEGDVQAVIGNIMRAKFGEDWTPSDGVIYAAVSRASVSDAVHGDLMRDIDAKLGDLAKPSTATSAEPVALDHLGDVLYMLAELHDDDRCTAYDNALAFYNSARPNARIAPVEGFSTRLHHTTPLDATPPSSGNADAVRDDLAENIKHQREEGDGMWAPCSGCHESVDGASVSPMDFVFGCYRGGGCSECGGIGAIWDTTDYEDMARSIIAADAALSSAPVAGEWQEALKPFADLADAMYVSGHCGGASPENWPDKWSVSTTGGKDHHMPQSQGGVLTVADFRKLARLYHSLSRHDRGKVKS